MSSFLLNAILFSFSILQPRSNVERMFKTRLLLLFLMQVLKRAVVLMIDEKRISREKVTRVYVTLGNIIGQNSGRLDEALEFNRRGIEVYPTIAEAHNSRGSILHQMNRLPEARASFEEAIKLNPQYANAHFNRGLVLLHMGDRKNAEQDFKKALSIDKNHFQAKAQLSLLREQQ